MAGPASPASTPVRLPCLDPLFRGTATLLVESPRTLRVSLEALVVQDPVLGIQDSVLGIYADTTDLKTKANVTMFQNRHSGFQRAQLHNETDDVHMQDAEPLRVDGGLTQRGADGDQCGMNAATPKSRRTRLIIAIDFGTTFSTVAYIAIEPDRPGFSIRPHHVLCVDHYPDIPAIPTAANLLESNENVPTELWYVADAPEENHNPPNTSEVDLTGYFSDGSTDDPITANTTRVDGTRDGERRRYLWGFGVHAGLLRPHGVGDAVALVMRFKLMLDFNGGKTEDLRKELSNQTRILKRRKAIACKEQMISDYLEQLLKHAKTRLETTGDLFPESQPEFVLCVPNLWSESAGWIMHDAMASAIQTSGFKTLSHNCVDDLFIVAEPEAAAEFVLSSFLERRQIRAGQTFVMLDAGGGTVDATTYKLTLSDPVRLERQAIPHGADICGSSYLNDGYRKRIAERLQDENLPFRGSELDHYIDGLVMYWENGEKRSIDVTNPRRDPNDLQVPGVLGVLGQQLKAAKEEDNSLTVSKVILIGGFSESPSLVQVLRGYLARPQNFNLQGFEIGLLVPEPVSHVCCGTWCRVASAEEGGWTRAPFEIQLRFQTPRVARP